MSPFSARDRDEYQRNHLRLEEISAKTLGACSDEEVLGCLAERRMLQEKNADYERALHEEEERAKAASATREGLLRELAQLNASITPDQDDETLLTLVQERRVLEAKLQALDGETSGVVKAEPVPSEEALSAPISQEAIDAAEVPLPALSQEVKNVSDEAAGVEPAPPLSIEGAPSEEESSFSVRGTIVDGPEHLDPVLSSQEAKEYLDLLAMNPDDALLRLENLSPRLLANQAFMLRVAAVDPAYAMHYADAKTLKKNEDFHVRIASIHNARNSGNPLAEMLSEMRTGPVILAAVKHDFRNVRYLTPSVTGYEEILERAKEGARAKARALGKAIDAQVFLPKILRDDPAFREEIEKIIEAV